MCPGVSCKYTTPLEGLIGLSGNASKIIYSRGCNDMTCQDITNFSASAITVSSADAGILVIGLSQLEESEFRDRTTLRLYYQVTRRTSSMNLSEPLRVGHLGLWLCAADRCTFHLQRTIAAFKAFCEWDIWVKLVGNS